MTKDLSSLLRNVTVEKIKGGEILHAQLANNETVHIKTHYGEPALYIYFGNDVPKYGVEPITYDEAYRRIVKASKPD